MGRTVWGIAAAVMAACLGAASLSACGSADAMATSHEERAVSEQEQAAAYAMSEAALEDALAKDREYAEMGYGTGRESEEVGFSAHADPSHAVEWPMGNYYDNEIMGAGEPGASYEDISRALSKHGFHVVSHLVDGNVFTARCDEGMEFLDLWAAAQAAADEDAIRDAYPNATLGR